MILHPGGILLLSLTLSTVFETVTRVVQGTTDFPGT